MNANDLLELIGKTKDNHILEAAATRPQRSHLPRNRIVLVAVIAALSLLLVGCAAVYFWLQDMSIGTDTYTKYHDDKGLALEEPVVIERQVLTFAGYSDSATNQAAREWYAFCESYDPNHEFMTNEPDLPDIENNYEYVYGCYTTEMVDKLNEIVKKHDVKLLSEWVPIQRWQSDVALQEGLGVATLLKDGAQAEMGEVVGMLYPPYNYDLEFELTLTGADAAWTKEVWADGYYYHKDYLPSDGTWHLDIDSFEQWNYTTSDGVKLLLAMNTKGSGFIICEREEAFQVVAISGNTTGSAYPTADQVPGKEALEQMAECFDFTFTPKQIDKAAMQPAMDAAEAEYQAAHAYVPEVYSGYEDYLQEQCIWFSGEMCYVYHDLNGDGEQELLLGSFNEEKPYLLYQLDMQDGKVAERMWDQILCEGNVLMNYNDGYHSAYERWEFWKRTFTGEENDGQFLGCVIHNADGTWQMTTVSQAYYEAPTVTQAEAETFLSQFTPMELNWQPLDNYPLSDGTTVGDYLTSLDKTLSKEQLRQFYTDWWQERIRKNDWYTHYRIMDINGDGTDDLLLSGNGEFYWVGYTYRYGYLQHLSTGDMYLCENDVMESVSTYHEDPGIEIVEHEFYTLDGYQRVVLDYVAYNKSTASWQTDLDGTTISEAEAQAILAKYPRMDQGMRPISELIGE